jgi:hypothetical protein
MHDTDVPSSGPEMSISGVSDRWPRGAVFRVMFTCNWVARSRLESPAADTRFWTQTGFAAVGDPLEDDMRALTWRPVEAHDGNVFAPRPAGDATHGRWGRHWLRAAGAAAGAGGAGAAVALVSRRRRGPVRWSRQRGMDPAGGGQ